MIPVKRCVEYFNKYNADTEELGELIGRHDLPDIHLNILKNIVSPNKDDVYLYDIYDLNCDQLIKLNALLENNFDFFLDKYDYTLSCCAVEGYYDQHSITGKRKGGYPAPKL